MATIETSKDFINFKRNAPKRLEVFNWRMITVGGVEIQICEGDVKTLKGWSKRL